MRLPDSIPPERRDAARLALANTFGATPVETITAIPSGATAALLFRVDAGKHPYLLRIEGAPSPLRNPHQYVSQQIAAEAGIAPRLLYLDADARLIVTDFVVQKPLRDYPGGRAALVPALATLLHRLQHTRVFPVFVTYPDIVSRLLAHVRSTGLFADGLLDAHTEHLSRLCEATRWHASALVSSHNDLNPANILFDGERLWWIDWESAYRNDPLADVAILLDNLASTPELERAFLQEWHGRALDSETAERLTAIRALTRLYYAGVLLSASATMPRTAPDTDLSAPALAEFEQAIREGRLKPRTQDTIHIAGKMYLAAFLSGGPVPALDTI
jgi:hypothetical protein